MTRTGLSPRLSQHLAEPFLDIHPADAAALSIAPASIVEVDSPSGWALLRARISDRQRRGEVFAPIHWTAEFASAARVDDLVASVTDPQSGQPESKAAVVRLTPWPARWFGFVVAAAEIAPETGYWCRARAAGGWRAEVAELAPPADPEAWLRAVTGAQKAQAMQVTDPAKGLTRIALVERGRLVAALFAGPEPVALTRSFVADQLGQPGAAVLAGRPGADRPDPGATLCTCLNVGINAIVTAIETRGLVSVAQVGAALGAGTNCGSCRSEIAALIEATRHRQAAE
jgi:assimilatory nitrate reductase catalytic subunit